MTKCWDPDWENVPSVDCSDITDVGTMSYKKIADSVFVLNAFKTMFSYTWETNGCTLVGVTCNCENVISM